MADFIDEITNALESKQTIVVATVVGPVKLGPDMLGRKLLLREDGTTVGSLGAASLDRRLMEVCRDAMVLPAYASVHAYELTDNEEEVLAGLQGSKIEVFVETIRSTETLLIVGAGHIARPLSVIGKMLGFEVVVIDDRPSFANRQRFPEADRVIAGYFRDELSRLPITPSTYVILVTRGHIHDEESLRQIVGSGAAYIGMIGSRRRVGAVLRHMLEEGIPREQVERVYSPIGLEIGAQTPEEIAISIMAEVVFVRRRGVRHPSSISAHQANVVKSVGEDQING